MAVVVVGLVATVAAGCKWGLTDTTSPGTREAREEINALLDQADEAEAQGDDAAAAALRDEAHDRECEVFACADVGTTTVLFDPTLAGGFFDAPWPSDTRRHPDGTIDLTGFPGRSTNAI